MPPECPQDSGHKLLPGTWHIPHRFWPLCGVWVWHRPVVGASSQRGWLVRAPRGEGPREGPDARPPVSLASLCCGHIPLAWGPLGSCLSPCPSAPIPAHPVSGLGRRAARPHTPESEGSPIGSGSLCLSGGRGGISPDRFACCGGLASGALGAWGGGTVWGGVAESFRRQSKVVLLDGLLGFVS